MDQMNFISKVSEESLAEAVSFENLKGETQEYPLWQMIHETFQHSIHHRAQLSLMLRLLECRPPKLDFVRYLDLQESTESSAGRLRE
jgi:uncharacterized damage-inducible protein DinB